MNNYQIRYSLTPKIYFLSSLRTTDQPNSPLIWHGLTGIRPLNRRSINLLENPFLVLDSTFPDPASNVPLFRNRSILTTTRPPTSFPPFFLLLLRRFLFSFCFYCLWHERNNALSQPPPTPAFEGLPQQVQRTFFFHSIPIIIDCHVHSPRFIVDHVVDQFWWRIGWRPGIYTHTIMFQKNYFCAV